MKGSNYEYIQRPNYEMIALVVWVAGCLVTYFLYLTLNLPSVVFEVMGLVCATMSVGRGFPAVNRYFKDRQIIGGTLLEFIPWHFADRQANRKDGKVWLGTGFPWTQKCIQAATDFLNRGNDEYFHKSQGRWIHGIGPRKDQDIEIESDLLQGHTLVVGSTGTGKTRFFDPMIAQAIFRGEPVIIIDPKGDPDLSGKAKQACELMGTPNRFLFFNSGFADRSVCLDPMKNWHEATELASRVAALIPSEAEADPFQAFGWKTLNSIIQGLVYLDQEPPNLVNLRRYVEVGVEDILGPALEKYLIDNWPAVTPKQKLTERIKQYQEKAKQKSELAVEGLITMHQHNREHFNKMVASLIPILNMLTSGNLRYLLSPTSTDGDPRPALDLATIIEKKQVLYIGSNSMGNDDVGSAIGSIILADLTAVASARYKQMHEMEKEHGQKHKLPPVNVFIDEAAEVVNDPAIQLLNKSRGAGFRVVIATQTLADLEVRTGSKAGARQVIANTNNWIIFRVIDDETQKYIAEAFPKTAVKSMDLGYRSSTKSDDPVQFTGTYTESLRETETSMVPPGLLGMLPNFQYFARFGAKGTIWKGKVPILQY